MLSVKLQDGLANTRVPFATGKGIWEKAEALLSEKENSLVHAPGFGPKDMMDKSRSGSTPHFVTITASGTTDIQYRCDDKCLQYKSIGMCSHVIAVSEYNCDLSEFLKWYCTNRGTKSLNLSDLGHFGMPQGAGRKGGKAPRKKKSGNRVHNRVPSNDNRVPLNVTTAPVTASVSASTPTGAVSTSTPRAPVSLHDNAQAFLVNLLVPHIRIGIGPLYHIHHGIGIRGGSVPGHGRVFARASTLVHN